MKGELSSGGQTNRNISIVIPTCLDDDTMVECDKLRTSSPGARSHTKSTYYHTIITSRTRTIICTPQSTERDLQEVVDAASILLVVNVIVKAKAVALKESPYSKQN